MNTALELLYEYRHLMGKCRSGAGLEMDEIQTVDAIEAIFTADDIRSAKPRGLTTTVRRRNGKVCDEVQLESVLIDRLVVARCPWLEAPDTVEIMIEDAELMLSYRFMGKIAWTREDGDGMLTAGVELVGVPVLVRRGPRTKAAPAALHPARVRAQAA